jgi:hypothetical protein
MLRDAVRNGCSGDAGVAGVGVKTTPIVQDALPDMPVPQVFVVTAKSAAFVPVTAKLVSVKVSSPSLLLVMVTCIGGLGAPAA